MLIWIDNDRLLGVFAHTRARAHRQYSGRLSYEPMSDTSASASASEFGSVDSSPSSPSSPTSPTSPTSRYTAADFFRDMAVAKPPAGTTAVASEMAETPTTAIPPLSEPVPAHWETIEGVFTMIWACGTSHQVSL